MKCYRPVLAASATAFGLTVSAALVGAPAAKAQQTSFSIPFFLSSATTSTCNSDQCILIFNPTNTRTMITNVGCTFNLGGYPYASPPQIIGAYLGSYAIGTSFMPLPILTYNTQFPSGNFGISATTLAFFEAGDRPLVMLLTLPAWPASNLVCSISGFQQ